ncbi:uncharacterized protein LOC113290701 [Papaver somniferum]|uniref:uncharacterized protein LOC113290701 n=1 Tax=Papaver somniferum TaxID=3469 RepID=UPI000E6F9886|nr:uncharacterized protein LOC113290701 [Papaver somniferum]
MEGMQGITTLVLQQQQNTDSDIKDLQTQVAQLATDMNLMKDQASTKFHSQPFVKLRESIDGISLRSGRQVEQPNQQDEVHRELVEDKEKSTPKENSKEMVPTFTSPPPFPSRFAKSKKELEYTDIWDILKQVQINILLIEVFRQIPRYAKLLKELRMKKKRLKGNEVMNVGENASAIILKKLPPKLKDPGSFTIPCTIGKKRFTRALLDLGVSVNFMPSSIYDSLNLGPLKETGVVLELDNRSNVYPKGIVDKVLVQVNELVFPADFYVLDMNDENSPKSTRFLLGRPFLSTAGTKIHVQIVALTTEFDGEVICCNIFETKRYPSGVKSCFALKRLMQANESDKS